MAHKYKLFEKIVLTKDIHEKGLKRSDVATIVDHHPVSNGEDGYSLEVFDILGNTKAVITLPESEITKLVLSCVVNLGFAGSRCLYTKDDHVIKPKDFEDELLKQLIKELDKFKKELKLSSQHFFCGISQIAIGADMLFARACQKEGIPHRLFLPQHFDQYLEAVGNNGQDFNTKQKDDAKELSESGNIIQKRVVSDAHDRRARFEETNLEILRASDVVVCLIRKGSEGKIGGTHELFDLAIRRGKLVLKLNLTVKKGLPELTRQQHNLDYKKKFTLPKLPHWLTTNDSVTPKNDDNSVSNLIRIEEYTARVKEIASNQANDARWGFEKLARTIIYTHIIATILATLIVLVSGFHFEGLTKKGIGAGIIFLLAGEMFLLAIGIYAHHSLHHKKISRDWASSRLVAEIARSVMAIQFPCQFNYLLNLSLPDNVRRLTRTMNTLHLRSTHTNPNTNWKKTGKDYIEKRLTVQSDYYKEKLDEEKRKLIMSKELFVEFSIFAIVATLSKLLIKLFDPYLNCKLLPLISGAMGFIAIVSPVIAVGAVSLAAALDWKARVHTYQEMVDYLKQQENILNNVDSAIEVEKLILETESHLLGETANWFTRRSFTDVA